MKELIEELNIELIAILWDIKGLIVLIAIVISFYIEMQFLGV